MQQQQPYGSWRSPLTSDVIVAGTIGLEQVAIDGGDIYWVEARPAEAGRNVIVRLAANGATSDVTPAAFNARTRVHEYGGGAFAVADGVVYSSNFSDQRIYRQRLGETPQPITHEANTRYADAAIDRRRQRMICVREAHTAADVVNTLASIDLEGGEAARVMVPGNDFYASPRVSPDGARLAWLTWNHPNMPWDGTELWVGDVAADGSLANSRLVAGGLEESIYHPDWSPTGELYFVSDRTGWWNLYRQREGSIEAMCPREAEFGRAQWVFGLPTYAFLPSAKIVCAYNRRGAWGLGVLDAQTRTFDPIDLPYSEIGTVRASGNQVVFVAGAPTEASTIVRMDPTSGRCEVLRRSSSITLDSGYLSTPEAIEFPTEGGKTAHGFYYAPRNRDFVATPSEKPPLVVRSHGGPTSAFVSTFRAEVQFWTSRGFAVLDVNYGGSTGYGSAYRQRLDGNWGIVDVDDCVNGARFLAARGDVDPQRQAIRGGSAGGYTTLCALTFRKAFQAGASYYGVSDLEGLTQDTHKFEARYLDRLIGAYPEHRERYRERSPIHFAERISCPVILFQGLEDAVVPPQQAEIMVEALRAKKLPVAYVPFAGEQHGFRQAANIKRSLDAELYFYSRIFGFSLADPVEPVPIENLPE